MRLLPLLVIALIAEVVAQSPATPGNRLVGAVSGVVVSDEEPPRPVRRSVVTVTNTESGKSVTTLTDDRGRFGIQGLSDGAYTITASRAGFITSAFGAQRPARRGRSVRVTAGREIEDVVVKLWRGAVLAGTVTDAAGRPLPGLTVRAISEGPNASAFPTLTNNPATTDEQGAFRLFGLEPGRYYLMVPPKTPVVGAVALRDSVVDRVLEQLTRGNSAASGQTAPVAPEDAQLVSYAPVFWPAAYRAADAAAVSVAAGEIKDGLTVSVIPVATAVVSGRVIREDGGSVAGATVRLTDSRAMVQLDNPLPGLRATTQRDGSFEVKGVPPGVYQVSSSLPLTSGRSGGSTEFLWAQGTVEVFGADVRNLLLGLAPGLSVSGRIEVVDASGPPTLEGVSLALMPPTTIGAGSVDVTGSLGQSRGGALVDRAGNFTVNGLEPGRAYQLFINGLGADFWSVSARIGAADLFDGPVVLTAENTRGPIAIQYAYSRTTLRGRFLGKGLLEPVYVIAFSANRNEWSRWRSVKAVQPNADDWYQFDNLPEGDYWVGAIGDVDPDAWKSESFLDQLQQYAVKITLVRGREVRLDLRAGR